MGAGAGGGGYLTLKLILEVISSPENVFEF